VSKKTIGSILDLKSKDLLPDLENIVLFDQPDDLTITLATQVNFNLYHFNDLVKEGHCMLDQ
jgi:hypothetical protein